MKEELKEIALKLKEWCDKYEKDYVTMCFTEKSIMANLSVDDADYEKSRIFVDFRKNNKEGN